MTDSDEKYPHSKLNILNDDAPVVLYCMGNIEALNQETIAIIGTREPDEIYKEPGMEIASLLAKNGFSIVSGLAMGCDTLGHIGALKSSGVTTAVLANGLDTIYPKENAHLANEIIDNDGCLVTEYPPYTKIERWYFPQRDRLQSALSDFFVCYCHRRKRRNYDYSKSRHQAKQADFYIFFQFMILLNLRGIKR